MVSKESYSEMQKYANKCKLICKCHLIFVLLQRNFHNLTYFWFLR